MKALKPCKPVNGQVDPHGRRLPQKQWWGRPAAAPRAQARQAALPRRSPL